MTAASVDLDAPVRASAEGWIAAPPERVWDVQADLRTWPRWNPAVSRIDLRGPLEPGTVFTWKAGGLPIRSVLREVDRPRRLAWSGRAPGIRAEHVWVFSEEGQGTRVETEESFSGLLPRILPGLMGRMLARSLEEGVEALRAECERRVRDGGG